MKLLETVNHFVWGVPALLMILGVGLYLSICTGFAQFRYFPKAIKAFACQLKGRSTDNRTSPYSALCTALAATVGTGNIVGVAGAITIGGPGAIFWMWICAFLGMILKFAEATLAVRYRVKNAAGEYVGGPMYMISLGMGDRWRFLGAAYCLFGVVAAFGVGNTTQLNAILMSVDEVIFFCGGTSSASLHLLTGVLLAALTAAVLLGGAKRVGDTAQGLVPFASVCYLVLCLTVLALQYRQIPSAFAAILRGAFDPKAVTGGALGSAFVALRIGTSRGTFTNEAGMGTASIAHAGADVTHPVGQGLMGIVEVFLDTIVICTTTALAVLCSGISIPYGSDSAGLLTGAAFSAVLGDWSVIPLSVAVCCFAFATVIGWSMYGARCAQYLFGAKSWRWFVFGQVGAMIAGVFMSTDTVWLLAETMNGLMAIPNLTAIIYLSPELLRLIKETGAQEVLRRGSGK